MMGSQPKYFEVVFCSGGCYIVVVVIIFIAVHIVFSCGQKKLI